MLKNYFLIAFRTLKRNLAYSFINIIGLSVGIASCVLILLWVYDEMTFNQYFTKYDNLYAIEQNSKTENGITTRNFVPESSYTCLLRTGASHRVGRTDVG